MIHPATRCLIAVGSNLGDRLANVRSAITGLEAADGVEILAVSKLYETAPVGGPDDQGPFYNGVLLVDSTLGAADLLALLHRFARFWMTVSAMFETTVTTQQET